eukprot:TCONS_00006282-protein
MDSLSEDPYQPTINASIESDEFGSPSIGRQLLPPLSSSFNLGSNEEMPSIQMLIADILSKDSSDTPNLSQTIQLLSDDAGAANLSQTVQPSSNDAGAANLPKTVQPSSNDAGAANLPKTVQPSSN